MAKDENAGVTRLELVRDGPAAPKHNFEKN
jgi:hypothetical protein